MFFFWKKTIEASGLMQGLTDWHCHLLPGVDDGVQSLSETLDILTAYEQAGIAKVWLTPHIMDDIANETADLRARFAQLCQAYRGPLRLHLAAENMIDRLFDQRLAAGDLLPIGTTERMLLVETSYFNPPMNLHQRLQQVKDHGYVPLLAHPERYMYMDENGYRRLKEMGIAFQLNLTSLAGFYGPIAQKKAEQLLAKGSYNLVGTDLHQSAAFDRLLQARLSRSILDRLRELCIQSARLS